MQKKLGELLIETGEISNEQLRCALEIQRRTGQRIGEILVYGGAVSAVQLGNALSNQKQLVTGIVLAAGMGLGAAAGIPGVAATAGPPARQTQAQSAAASVPLVLEVNYTGNPILAFNINDADIRAGYRALFNRGDVLWHASSSHWALGVEHNAWNTVKPLQLYIKATTSEDPNDPGWTYIDEGPTTWVEGNTSGRGKLAGVDWMVLLPVTGMMPGVYMTAVSFSISDLA